MAAGTVTVENEVVVEVTVEGANVVEAVEVLVMVVVEDGIVVKELETVVVVENAVRVVVVVMVVVVKPVLMTVPHDKGLATVCRARSRAAAVVVLEKGADVVAGAAEVAPAMSGSGGRSVASRLLNTGALTEETVTVPELTVVIALTVDVVVTGVGVIVFVVVVVV